MFYQGYILPLIDYGSITWGTTSKNNVERTLELQKRAARIILNANYDTASSYMFEKLGWSTITKRHNYNKAILIYKALNNLTPTYISDLLTPMSQSHIRTLRSSTDGSPGRVAQSVGHLTRKSGVLGSIPGLATYFRFSFRFFKKGSCQLLAKVCARSTG